MAAIADRSVTNPATEQYLAAIFLMEEDGAQVVQARLAERLGHSAPTVSEMVHRLRDARYITIDGRVLRLTTSGRDLAASVIRKHRLAARLMTDVLGVPWSRVHAEADRWEHVISDDVEARLVELLRNPATCPHGCPIPGSGAAAEPTTVLADAQVGQRVCLARVLEMAKFDPAALAYLEDQDFTTGAEAVVAAQGPDGSVVLKVGDRAIVMGASMAKLLCVRAVA
ncbi:MAG TPA: metal-dependent transcriptional regulator [Acidimicrobiales bacterium]|nr:metal-dependent transcriptional regulator [Acidimicrobiales bacterium]